MREIKPKKKIRPSMIIAGVIVLALLATTPFIVEQIEPGQVGVVYTPSSGVKDETLSQGWHVVSPITRVTEYPIRTQTKALENMTLATKDGKNIVVDFTYSFSVSPDKVTKVFNKFGPIEIDEIAKGYLKQRLYDASREQISKVTVLELFGEKSGNVSTSIQTQFAEDVKEIGFIIEDVALGAPKPDEKTQEAIDARVKASQELDKKKTDLEIAKAEAERLRVEAKGAADARLIEAQGLAKAQKELQKTLTEEMIQYEAVKKWDGKSPLVSGSGSMVQLPIPDSTTTEEKN